MPHMCTAALDAVSVRLAAVGVAVARIRRTFKWSKKAREVVRANLAATGLERTRLIAQIASITEIRETHATGRL